MVESQNTKVDLTAEATWFRAVAVYGKAIVGDKAFEFYNELNLSDYVQIQWNEVTYVVADVHFKGRYIPRFEIRTRTSGTFIFTTKNNKETLRAIRKYVPADHMRQALSLWQNLKRRFLSK
ncbi:DUF956 family protein [Lactobacillus panisapium]|uniref:DUF956 family protein n=1 Tax=Lactobacillus panisapium TaxID=2012495 RepID=UPI001C6958D6|nr:DUF956 family protein [Lactobacillus panisapium]QYN54174.1 DUF956 family protein [Lactobacillus panisapium]